MTEKEAILMVYGAKLTLIPARVNEDYRSQLQAQLHFLEGEEKSRLQQALQQYEESLSLLRETCDAIESASDDTDITSFTHTLESQEAILEHCIQEFSLFLPA